MLEETLLRQRDSRWFRQACRHAEQCPACTRRLELHRLEEHLTELPTVEPSEFFVQAVMNRLTQVETVTAVAFRRFSSGTFTYPATFVGALMLAVAYVLPAAGESWLSSIWFSGGAIRGVEMSAYLAHHPPLAILLAGVASLLIVLGLIMPENRVPNKPPRASPSRV